MKLIDIAFDLDGVLVDIMTTVREIIKERYDIKIFPQTEWELHTEPQISDELIWKCIRVAYKQVSKSLIYPGAQELLGKLFHLSGCNDPIRIITSRPFDAANDTYRLLDERFTSFEYELILVSRLDKLQYLNRYRYMVEDRRKTAGHLANNGKRVFLIDRPYNVMAPVGAVTRVGDIRDLIPLAHKFIKELP